MPERPCNARTGPKHGWLRTISTRLHLDEARFSDEDVLQMLRAVEAGVRIGDLCTSQDIPVETYYRWQVRYGGVTLTELHRRRSRDRWYRRAAFGFAAVVVLGVVYEGVVRLTAPVGQPAVAVARSSTKMSAAPAASPAVARKLQTPAAAPNTLPAQKAPAVAPAAATAPAAQKPEPLAPAATAPAAQKPQAPALVPTPSPASSPVAFPDVKTADPAGFSVQVVAVSSVRDARKVVERLGGAGYSAYVTQAIAGQSALYRVRVGPFQSRELAEEAADRLKRDGYPTAWIAR